MALLEPYRRKRRFEKTPEPPGAPGVFPGNRFIVQKHAARRLHYDFRLEIDAVLKSWAVPKGPSLNPADKRLAVQTEDHPLEYADFEGTIPAGEYGAGTVMVWDRGTFELVGKQTLGEQLARGELKFILQGRKLRGSFVLVKLKRSEKGNEWLLIKHKDAAADGHWDIEEHDGSVLTGRALEEIAEGLPGAYRLMPAELEGARKAPPPERVAPMLTTLAEKPFSHPDWLFEIKWDGVRALAWLQDGRVTLRSRTGQDITAQYPELHLLPQRLQAKQAILDGEIVILEASGRSDFERMQERMHVRRPTAGLQQKAPVTYYVFDLLHCDGYDLRRVPLAERKRLLRGLLLADDSIRYSDHHAEQGMELFELAAHRGLEGIVGKHARSLYASGRSPYWLKLKVRRELDAVVGGWTAPRGAREHFGALLVGLHQDDALQFIGGVGTGFTQKTQKEIFQDLKKLATTRCSFAVVPETKEKAYWTKPLRVARVRFAGWTDEQRLREPVFLALRDDASPQECRLEGELPAARPPAPAPPPALAGRVLAKKKEIERELFAGSADNATIEIEGKRLRLTNLNKLYFPESGYRKRDLLAYYYRIADRLLPFLRQRPLVLRRYPDGITGESFFQKEAGEAAPEWMETVAVHSGERRQPIRYFVANDLAALLYLTNLGCVDHNPWASQRDALELPDYLFFDLDPSDGTDFDTVVRVARGVWKKLESLGIVPFLKTSGATGMHIYVPVERRYTYEQVRTFAEIVGRLVAAELPRLTTEQRTVAKRPRGRVYIDVSQNALGRPLAAVYTVRAFPRAPVSAPLEPGELRPGLRPERFNLKSILARVEKKGDLWAGFWQKRQSLEPATALLSEAVARRPRR